MSTQTLQAEIAGEERAIRHLIGERRALTSKIHRQEAQLKLHQAQLHRMHGHGGGIAPGDRFPDFSAWQPAVDLAAVRQAGELRAGELAITKLTEGPGWTDPYGRNRLQAMAANAFPHRGAYAFLHPSEDPVAQATHFLEAGGHLLTEADIAIADLEVTDGQPASRVAACGREFGLEIAKHSPAMRWLYGGGPFLKENGVELLPAYLAHWLPAYAPSPFPYVIYGRERTIAWQYTDGHLGPGPHLCPGIGACDLSIRL